MEKELLEKYAKARQEVDLFDAKLKAAKAELEDAVIKLHDDLSERGATKTAVYEGLGTYSMGEPTLYASCEKEKEEELFAFVRSKDRADLIKPSVHHRSLASFVNEVLESGETIPDFIKTYYKPTGRFYSDKGE